MIGCFMAGVAGGLYVFYITAWSPYAFLPLESFILLAALIVGGSGNYWGALLGAFVLIEGLAELSRYIPSSATSPTSGRSAPSSSASSSSWFCATVPRGSSRSDGCTGTARRRAGSARASAPSAGRAEPVGDAHDTLLDIAGLGFAYGGSWAVRDCSFTVARGQVTGLIGPNGGRQVDDHRDAQRGARPAHRHDHLRRRRRHPRGRSAHGRLGIARTFQTPRVLARLPVIENVIIAAPDQVGENPLRALFWQRSFRDQEAALRAEARTLLEWLGLEHHVEQPAGTLSGGQRRLMEIARALMAHPKLMLLDEPTAGVFPETSRLIATRVRDIVEQGVTVVLIAHNMGFLSTVADDVVVMAEGKVLTRGPLEVVRQHEEVIAAYLGATSAEQMVASSDTGGAV